MKKISQLILLAGLIFFDSSTLKAEDFEVWTFVGAGTEWKNVEFSLTSANFFDTGDRGRFLHFTQISFDFASKSNFNLGFAYKQEYVKILNQTRTEYRPMLHLFYTKEWGAFELRDRNRWEFRIIDGKLINRYRNQLQLSFTRFNGIIPYVNTESSFYFNPIYFARQRTTMGFNVPVKSVNLIVFAGHQVDDFFSLGWLNKFMLGTSLNYIF